MQNKEHEILKAYILSEATYSDFNSTFDNLCYWDQALQRKMIQIHDHFNHLLLKRYLPQKYMLKLIIRLKSIKLYHSSIHKSQAQ
jgi:hypothetical protein